MVLAEDLRQAVLQAALQGKLTEQLDTDSDVDEFILQIKRAKKDLVGAKEIKKESNISDICEEEFPCNIPDNWKFEKLGNLFYIERGASPRPISAYITSAKDGVNWIKIGDTEVGGKYVDSTKEKITKEGAEKSRAVKVGDFIFSNSMSFGRPYIMNIDGCIHDGWNVIHNIHSVDNDVKEFNQDYLYFVLSSAMLKQQIIDKAEGGVVKNIRSDNLRDLVMPIPPIEEQERIVDKINEIMLKIDEYEKIEKELETLKKEFPTDMKDALLQAAMQGKLTEQLESDSSVDNLLQEIGEKELKDSNWKAKKELEIDEILDIIDSPFIPNSWKWVKLSDVAFSNIGLTYKPSDKTEDGVIVLRSSNIQNGKMDYNDIVKVNMEIPENKMCDIGDILMCVRNGSKSLVGKVAVIDKSNMSFGAFMSIIKSRCNQFLYYFFNSNMFKRQMHINSSTETINQITQDMLFNCIIPLPPIEEQQRIVERLYTLLPLCEDLRE